MQTLVAQLRRAWSKSGWSLNELIDYSGLDMTKVSMSRKLRGLQPLSTEECEALALTMKVRVAFGKARKASS